MSGTGTADAGGLGPRKPLPDRGRARPRSLLPPAPGSARGPRSARPAAAQLPPSSVEASAANAGAAGAPGPSAPATVWPALGVPIAALPGVGPARRRQLGEMGIHTVEQVLRHLPRRHEDRTHLVRLGDIRSPGVYTVVVTVLAAQESRPRPRLTLVRARVTDGSTVMAAAWFNRGYLRRIVVPGAQLLLHGPVVPDRGGRLAFRAPEVEAAPRDARPAAGATPPAPAAGLIPARPTDGTTPAPPAHGPTPPTPPAPAATGLIPIYPLSAGLTQRAMRAVAEQAVSRFAEFIPDTVAEAARTRLRLLPSAAAWRGIHLPTSAEALEDARRSIVFEELFHLQVGLLIRRRERAGALRGFRTVPPGELTRRFTAALPYRLTGAQRRVLHEIDADLAAPHPMYRLVQGDVGSGKTVVAAAAMLRAVEGGHQAALLAPTEILAEQHFLSLQRLYGDICRVELLTGSTPRAIRRQLLAELAAGRIAVLVGTHALLQPDVSFTSLGLAVTDEQHRFGVRQRDALAAKGRAPDVLVLTATPIPRTLAMTLYGDLDVSVIDELPPGRRRVRTYTRAPESRSKVYAFVRDQVLGGRQAYVVCPLITDARADDQEQPPPAAESLEEEAEASAEAWAARLAETLPQVRIGLLHGRMPSAAKEETMARFTAGEIQVLVATTVIEVGVDVPNATVIVIEDADRFGLAQLHQLRGRVGRGAHASYCILIARGGRERLEVLTRTADGFVIAEEDLRQRGPGEVMGTRQHGLPELALADPVRDGRLLQEARDLAATVLRQDPELSTTEHNALRAAVEGLFGRPRG